MPPWTETLLLFGRDDSEFYGQVAEELSSGFLEPAAWAKALGKSGGDEKRAKALYIEYRVKRLKAEASEERQRQAHEQRERRVREQRECRAREAAAREELRVRALVDGGELTPDLYTCPNCQFSGRLRIVERSDGCLCALLFLLFVIPAILYARKCGGYAGVCPNCSYRVVPRL